MLKYQNFLSEIAQNLHQSAPQQAYEEATLTYECDEQDTWSSFLAYFSIEGKIVDALNFDDLMDHLTPILQKLHQEMKADGQDWRKFTLTINQARKVTTLFDYAE